MKLQKVLNHKYFLYAAYALMVVNILGYVSVSSLDCIVVFALATYLCKYCLSKNKGLCIFVGLFVANVLFGCGRVKEGLREGNSHCDDAAAASASTSAECADANGNWNTDGTSPVCECPST